MMVPALKLLTGLAGTSLVAAAAWQVTRTPLLSDLGTRSADVMLANGITDGSARWVSPAGWTSRRARLSGTADPATRERTRLAIAALPGVATAVWQDDAGTPAAPALALQPIGLAECKARVEALATRPIAFGATDATIAPASIPSVDALAQALGQCPGVRIAVIGEAGAQGSAAVALALARARAETVASALAARGVPAAKLSVSAEARDPMRLAPAAVRFQFGTLAAGRNQEPAR